MSRKNLFATLHLFLFLSSILVTVYGVVYGFGAGQRGEMLHFGFFKTFTIDSNLFNGLVSLLVAVYLLKGKTLELPRYLAILQYAAAISVGLTFFVVLVFLAPMGALSGESFFSAFAGTMFFFHFLNPVLSCFLYVCGNQETKIGRKEIFLGTLPLVLYATYYMTSVILLKTMEDFYGFTFGGHNAIAPVSVAVVYGATYGIARVLLSLNRRYNQNQRA